MQLLKAPFDRVCQVAMLEKHNRMLVELLSRQHPSGSLAASDVHALMKVRHRVGLYLGSLLERTTDSRQHQAKDIGLTLDAATRVCSVLSFQMHHMLKIYLSTAEQQRVVSHGVRGAT